MPKNKKIKGLKEISTRLEIAKKKIAKNADEKAGSNVTYIGKALKISTELVAAVFVGTILGFILDNWFGTKPWLKICFFIMCLAAGISNVFKSAKKMHKNYKD